MPAKVLGATALALLVGVSVSIVDIAAAQNGGEARSNDRALQKELDDKHLTPIRPIRRVGPEGWPAAKDPRPTNLPPETTGQSASNDRDSAKQDDAKRDTAQQDTKPAERDTAQQDQAAPMQDRTRNEAAQQRDTAKQTQPQDTAKQETKPQQPSQDRQRAEQPAARDDRQQDTALSDRPQDNQQASNQDSEQDQDEGFASIRLGTDRQGRVAVNEAQERQIARALRKQDINTFDVDVTVGAVAPADVRLGAVSADLVAVLPQFRGYSFFATRDQIVIVEPDTSKVVALVPVKRTATASKPREERTTRKAVRKDRDRDRDRDREVTVGRGVPSEAEILGAPVVTVPAGRVVTRSYRTYRVDPPETVIIERRPRLFRLR